jgi:hypothetical protein
MNLLLDMGKSTILLLSMYLSDLIVAYESIIKRSPT